MKSDSQFNTHSKKQGRALRRLISKIHLWAAIIGSLPCLLLCLTGLILVFEKELQSLEERAHTHIEVDDNTPALSTGEILHKVSEVSGANPIRVVFPQEATQALLITTDDSLYHFVNQYDFEILGSKKIPAIAMRVVRVIHTSFFMGDFGTWIAIISSLFLISLSISGCYLFLKRKLSLRKSFRIHWKPEFRRNYDLHSIIGFITAIPILLIALSGSLIGLGAPWRETILFLTDSEWKPRPKLESPIERSQWNFEYEQIFSIVQESAPKDMYIHSMILPQKSEDPIYFRLLYPWANRPASWAFINPKDGTLLEFHNHWDYELGHLIHRLNRGFHSGELYTDGMRWLWFTLMLSPFFLAYTGYKQWSKKRSPKKKQI